MLLKEFFSITTNQKPQRPLDQRGSLNQQGQGLLEYLLLAALIAVGTLGVLRVLSQTLSAKFATVTYAIQGKQKSVRSENIQQSHIKKKDMKDFFHGVGKTHEP